MYYGIIRGKFSLVISVKIIKINTTTSIPKLMFNVLNSNLNFNMTIEKKNLRIYRKMCILYICVCVCIYLVVGIVLSSLPLLSSNKLLSVSKVINQHLALPFFDDTCLKNCCITLTKLMGEKKKKKRRKIFLSSFLASLPEH